MFAVLTQGVALGEELLPFQGVLLQWMTALSGRVAAMDLDSVEHNLDEIVDGALVAGVGAEGTAVGDDHAAG